MTIKSIRKDQELGVELFHDSDLGEYHIWSLQNDFYGWAEQEVGTYTNEDDANQAFADLQSERAEDMAAQQ